MNGHTPGWNDASIRVKIGLVLFTGRADDGDALAGYDGEEGNSAGVLRRDWQRPDEVALDRLPFHDALVLVQWVPRHKHLDCVLKRDGFIFARATLKLDDIPWSVHRCHGPNR